MIYYSLNVPIIADYTTCLTTAIGPFLIALISFQDNIVYAIVIANIIDNYLTEDIYDGNNEILDFLMNKWGIIDPTILRLIIDIGISIPIVLKIYLVRGVIREHSFLTFFV